MQAFSPATVPRGRTRLDETQGLARSCCPLGASRPALPPRRQRMADVITCSSGLSARVRGMKVREERVGHRHPRPVREGRRRVLLQAVGRKEQEEGRPRPRGKDLRRDARYGADGSRRARIASCRTLPGRRGLTRPDARPTRPASPTPPAARPTSPHGHRPERPLGHRLGAVDGFEGQHLLLEVGGQHEQVEELRDPRSREPQLARQGGLVGHQPAFDGGLQVVRERELAGQPWRGVARARACPGAESG